MSVPSGSCGLKAGGPVKVTLLRIRSPAGSLAAAAAA
jgi:hypothetical protein